MLLTSGALLLSLEVEGRLEPVGRPPIGPPPPPPRKKAGPEGVEASPISDGGRGLVEAEKGSGGSVEREWWKEDTALPPKGRFF